MAEFVLFDDEKRSAFLPLSYTRSVADFRWGIRTIREKWDTFVNQSVHVKTEDYLQPLYGHFPKNAFFINSRLLPSADLFTAIQALKEGEVLEHNGVVLAYHGFKGDNSKSYSQTVVMLIQLWELFSENHREIARDFDEMTQNRTSEKLSSTVNRIGKHPVFMEKGAKAEFCTLNTSEGPIYLAKDSEVQEGCLVRGPFALGEHSTLKMGARIYSGTSIGPHSKVGGEVSNSIIFGYSNKAHEGFLGNSVLGEWCNLGADTNNSNLKNNYEEVKIWSEKEEKFVKTGLQFCGLFMGDHSKTGINTMLNTGTVVGVSSNVFGSGFPRNVVPSFSWGGAAGMTVYQLQKALDTAKIVMSRRDLALDETQKNILGHVFEITAKFRK
jgi:UDP-N-acetylglucosamine diphosphorylase/glucosamine-1-phosphate N-acetyltransferase